MVKQLLLLATALLFFQVSEVYAQINTVVVNPGPYTPESTIAATFSLGSTSCIRPGNRFQLFLSDPSGNFGSEVPIGEFNGFYSTFVNGTVPPGTVPGTGYRVRVKSTDPALTSAPSNDFRIEAGAAVLAKVTSAPVIGPEMFGSCPGRDGRLFNFTNESSSTSFVSGTITNELDHNDVSNFSFVPANQINQFRAKLAHYTLVISAKMPDGTVGTKAYMVVNNNVSNSFSTSGSNVVCLPGGFLQYGVDISSTGILNNYPGNTYRIDWGDGNTDTYTFCDLKSAFVRHEYLRNSCGNPAYSTGGNTIYNVFGINISVIDACGPVSGAISTYVKVVTKPENRFFSPETACTNSPVTFENYSVAGQDPGSNTPECAENDVTYNWYVNDHLLLAGVSRSTNFTHTFTTHGVYDVKLESITEGVCEGLPVTQRICIQDPPRPAFDFDGAQLTDCAPFTIQAFDRSEIDALCNANNTYNWIVSPSAGVQFNPADKNPVFTFSNPGTYSVTLQIRTASCGVVSTEMPQQIVLVDGQPVATLSDNVALCALNTFEFNNTTTGPTRTTFSGTQQDIPNSTYTWYVTESDGSALSPGDFSFERGTDLHTKYPAIKFNQFKTYKIRVVHKNTCRETEDIQFITFSSSPVPNITASPNPICYDAIIDLQGDISGANTSFQWLGNGGTFSDPTSLTTTYTPSLAERNSGTTTIRLLVNTGLQGNCAQVEDNVVITIYPRNTGTDQVQEICTENAVSHTPASTISGSTYSWIVDNPDGNASGHVAGSGTAIADVITNRSRTANAVVIYTITPKSNGCLGDPYTFTVAVTPKPEITAVPSRSTICSNESTAIALNSTLSNTRYTWTSLVSGTVTGNSNASTSVTASAIDNTLINVGSTRGSVTYTITPYSASGCPGESVSVTVNVDPALSVSNAGLDRNICATASYTLEATLPVVGTGTWSITSAHSTPPVNFVNVNDPTTTVSGLTPGETYKFTWTVSAPGACRPNSDEVVIVVNEPTNPGTTAGPPSPVCANDNTGTITLTGNVGQVIGWERSLDGAAWAAISGTNTGTTYTFNNLSETTQYRAVVRNGGCTTEYSTPTVITVTPATTIAIAGPSQTLCDELETLLDADATLKPGEAGRWSVSPSATILEPTDPKSKVTGLIVGQTYTFTWTITGNSPCRPSSSQVVVTNNPPINQTISSTTAEACYGQQVIIDGHVPTGGSGSNYMYSWEIKVNAGNWDLIPNEASEDLTITLTTSGTISFRRTVTSGGCNSISNAYPITVHPPITDNNITANQTICSGERPQPMTGLPPNGGGGTFIYQWQSSENETTWINIGGANAQDYQPTALTQTMFYRRAVSTLACSGAFQKLSNVVKISVNPNAKAEFSWTTEKGCAPFELPITTVAYPDRNDTYTWYANTTMIGTGTRFPGYTIADNNQQVNIRLVVTSRLACTSHEFSQVFSTIQTVPASFTQSDDEGCGPFSVNFTNTSVLTAGATFQWDFGNGRTATQANPGTVVYEAEATGKDTTYVVTLTATTLCGSSSATSTVLVKAKPIAIFSPSKTDGCSPMTVNFTNTSPGAAGTMYHYDFGDGTAIVTRNDKSPVQHVYITTVTTTFRATLTVVSECGTDTRPYNIRVSPQNITPELVVDANEKEGCAPHTVNFDNNSIGASRFTFDFGDGSPIQTTLSTGKVPYTYTTPGTFTITMTAYNSCSEITTTETVTVLPQPLTRFEADNMLGCPGLNVKFKNNTQNGVSYKWDFGDGSPISTEFEPTHIYTGEQEYYTVTLTATNSLGCTMTVMKNQYIHIVQPPVAAFNVNPSTLINIPNYTFRFEDESRNSPTIWEWDFGDGTNSALKNPSHTYLDTGTYKVTLRVLNQQGCFTSTFKNVTIKGVPGYLFVPNSFVPGNTQPELREFRAKGSGIATWQFSIFNKWGQLLWETTKLEEGRPVEGWDGTFKGQQLPQGVYYWKVDVQMVNGSEWKGMTYDSSAPKRTGAIHLIR